MKVFIRTVLKRPLYGRKNNTLVKPTSGKLKRSDIYNNLSGVCTVVPVRPYSSRKLSS